MKAVLTSSLLSAMICVLINSAFTQDKSVAVKSAASRKVTASSVTINMPEGITKDQADAILNELHQIRQLLEKQQNVGERAAAQVAQQPQKAGFLDSALWSTGSLVTASLEARIVVWEESATASCTGTESASFAHSKTKSFQEATAAVEELSENIER